MYGATARLRRLIVAGAIGTAALLGGSMTFTPSSQAAPPDVADGTKVICPTTPGPSRTPAPTRTAAPTRTPLPTRTVAPTRTPAATPTSVGQSCQFSIVSVNGCLDSSGGVDYTITLLNTASREETVTGSVALRGKGGTVLGTAAIGSTTLNANGSTTITGRVNGTAGSGPYSVLVTIQDLQRVCASKTKNQPVQTCGLDPPEPASK